MGTPIPVNRAGFHAREIRDAVGGHWLGAAPGPDHAIVGVSTDSRAIRPGALFVAIAGDAHDGHQFLAQAATAGAAMALVEQPLESAPPIPILRVPSTLEALGALGRQALRRWRGQGAHRRVIALTGSAGKTTTRSVICALLRQVIPPAELLGTRGNLNNLIGVPMMVLGLHSEHRVAVLEFGTSLPGEIAALGTLAPPDVALVTLVAAAHTAGLGDIERVAAEKGAIFQALGPDGVAVGNGDDRRVVVALSSAPTTRRLRYGFEEGADYRICQRTVHPSGRAHVVVRRADGARESEVDLPLLGHAGAYALAAGLAVVEATIGRGLTETEIAAAMDELAADTEQGRLRLRQRSDGLLVVDDSYNANPASCRASLRAAHELAAVQGRPWVAILGEMRELGAAGPREHELLGRVVAETPPRLLIAVAGLAELVAREAAARGVPVCFAANADQAAREAVAVVEPADVVLIKGSRGIRTERVVAALMAADGLTDVPPTGAA